MRRVGKCQNILKFPPKHVQWILRELSISFLLNSKNEIHFVIMASSNIIGHISLSKRKDQWLETQIVIGEKDYWNQGYSSRAIKNLISKIDRLTKIYLEVRPDNLRAIKAYEKSGFKKVKLIKYPNNKYLPETLRMELVTDDESPV